MNIILLVVDSLRFDAVRAAATPFLHRLGSESVCFRRAYATECWTLPSHTAMFTGLLASQHQAHFQTMAYHGTEPTIAELCTKAGYHTEIVTRNPIFDGTIPGITRGFQRNVRLIAKRSTLDPLSLLLAASKPRFRRQIQSTGFFHPRHRAEPGFVMQFARTLLPADRRTLDYVVQRADELRGHRPFFLCANLFDVHAPYPPQETSILSPFWSLRGTIDNCVMMPFVLPRLGGHAYLRPGFRLSATSQHLLRARYDRAVALMDRKLEAFYHAARDAGILDDTLLIITSDHGEAFGEHDLYFHDASVYNTHLHVPLWVKHPARAPEIIDDVVSTRDLFGLMRAAALAHSWSNTIFDATYRRQHSVAVAEHFYYPHCEAMDRKYRQNQLAVISRDGKILMRSDGAVRFDLTTDPDEADPKNVDPATIDLLPGRRTRLASSVGQVITLGAA